MRAINKHYRRDAELQGVQGPVQGAAISVTQRMSSNLQLNLHWHVLLADGVWTEQDGRVARHAEVVNINGESWRLIEARERDESKTAARAIKSSPGTRL